MQGFSANAPVTRRRSSGLAPVKRHLRAGTAPGRTNRAPSTRRHRDSAWPKDREVFALRRFIAEDKPVEIQPWKRPAPIGSDERPKPGRIADPAHHQQRQRGEANRYRIACTISCVRTHLNLRREDNSPLHCHSDGKSFRFRKRSYSFEAKIPASHIAKGRPHRNATALSIGLRARIRPRRRNPRRSGPDPNPGPWPRPRDRRTR